MLAVRDLAVDPVAALREEDLRQRRRAGRAWRLSCPQRRALSLLAETIGKLELYSLLITCVPA
jgi:hypothetical protein